MSPSPARPSSRRGLYTIIAIFALGGVVLTGLFLAPRPKPQAAPDLPWEISPGGIDVAAMMVGPERRNVEPAELARFIRDNGGVPDLLLLFDIEAEQVPGLAQGLGMQQSYDPQHYQRVPRMPGSREKIGVMVLSRFPLYDAAPIVDGQRTPQGVSVTLVQEGRKLRVGGFWHFDPQKEPSLRSHWEGLSRPPALIVTTLADGTGLRGRSLKFTDWMVTDDGTQQVGRGMSLLATKQPLEVTFDATQPAVRWPIIRWRVRGGEGPKTRRAD